jgi:hypothetical protein
MNSLNCDELRRGFFKSVVLQLGRMQRNRYACCSHLKDFQAAREHAYMIRCSCTSTNLIILLASGRVQDRGILNCYGSKDSYRWLSRCETGFVTSRKTCSDGHDII